MVAEYRRLDKRTRGELVRLDRHIARDEARRAWGRVEVLSGRGHLSVVADRPDLSDSVFGEINHIARRALRQLGDTDDAA